MTALAAALRFSLLVDDLGATDLAQLSSPTS
jgi:hypothetical protein